MSVDVRRPRQYEEMLKKLCQEDGRIFTTYKDALVFAACLGFERQRRVSFDKDSDRVRMEVFRGEYDAAIFHCIGIAHTLDPTIMGSAREAERIKIFEEYACGGLEIIDAEVYAASGQWEQTLLAMVVKQAKGEVSVLDDITSAFA
jgi:dnd system-associated protein 4